MRDCALFFRRKNGALSLLFMFFKKPFPERDDGDMTEIGLFGALFSVGDDRQAVRLERLGGLAQGLKFTLPGPRIGKG